MKGEGGRGGKDANLRQSEPLKKSKTRVEMTEKAMQKQKFVMKLGLVSD